MRQIGVIGLCIYYFLLTLGITFSIHYCMGEVEEVTISATPKGCCCDVFDVPPGCCDDKQVELDFEADQQLATSSLLISIPAFTPLITYPPTLESGGCIHKANFNLKPEPPPQAGKQARIWYHALTLYG